VAAAVALVPLAAHGSAKKAFEHVKEGIQHYRSGDFEAAGRAFAEADVALPEDDRVAYDRACAYAAQGEADKAIELFREAAMSRDAGVAAGSHYNMGCVNAAKAKSIFGDQPEQAAPEVREQGLPMVVAAIGHYRDCLRIDPDHSGARRNLEVLRLWIKHMQDMWAKHDREKQREEMDLLTFLQMIEAQQTRLRQATQQLNAEKDSPRRRQAINATRTDQLQLAEEIEALKEKIQQSLQPPPAASSSQPGTPPPDSDQLQKAIGALNDMGNRARSAMLKAAGSLNDRDLPKAVESQTGALDALNQIYTAIAPFQNVLQKSTATEEALVGQSQQAVDGSADADSTESPPVDFDELARRQNLVAGWSQALPLKAEQELQQLEAGTAAPGSPAAVPIDPNADPQQAEQAKKALKQSFEKAIELGPKIYGLCEEASGLLDEKDAGAALPKQEEALKLLKEIAESLPKQQQQDQGQNDQQQQEKQQDQSQQQSSDNRDQQQQPRPQDLSRQQAEAVLRKVREREREHRERQKQLQHYLRGGVVVDKDW
jgi:hypothetical protein